MMPLLIALAILHVMLVAPDWPGNLRPLWFARLPVELPVIVLLLLLIPKRITAAVVVVALTVLAVLKVANLVAFTGFARQFNILVDPGLIAISLDTLNKGVGFFAAAGAVLAGIGAVGAIGWLSWWAARQMTLVRTPPLRRAGFALSVAWLAGVALTTETKLPGAWWEVASFESVKFARQRVTSVYQGIVNDREFRAAAASDKASAIPTDRLLSRLKGRDVLVVFVEAYGKAALDDARHGAEIQAALHQFETSLVEDGFTSRSAWVTSPTFGGQSWLAHSTLLSGLWVNNQRRYDSLFIGNHGTLVKDFRRAGWRSIGVMPEITMAWPEAAFFGYDKLYDAPTLGYRGDRFDYMTMPDQYTLSRLQAEELSVPGRPPLFAEVALVSSHVPWTPRPLMVPWDQIGDGSVFTEARTPETEVDWFNETQMRADYAASVDYVLGTLRSFIKSYGNRNMVIMVIGDHQPMPIVSGHEAPHEVPVHLIAADPDVLSAAGAWNWTEGMVPGDASPTWRMDEIRDRLVETFSAPPATAAVVGAE